MRTQAPMDMMILVGFGTAVATKDGEVVYDGEKAWHEEDEEAKTLKDIEAMALLEPHCDWRVVLHGPQAGETFQRRGIGKWIRIEWNAGFA